MNSRNTFQNRSIHTPAEQPQKISLRRHMCRCAVGTYPHKFLWEWRTQNNNWYLINESNVLPKKRTPDGYAEARKIQQRVIDGKTVVCSAVYHNKQLFIEETKNEKTT